MQEEFYADISPDGKSKFEIERSQTNQQKTFGTSRVFAIPDHM